jgi:hypothetical protein
VLPDQVVGRRYEQETVTLDEPRFDAGLQVRLAIQGPRLRP